MLMMVIVNMQSAAPSSAPKTCTLGVGSVSIIGQEKHPFQSIQIGGKSSGPSENQVLS